ncbi:cuticle protein AMP1A-like [Penaeus japonicus]|uniref:cuticle protein AMP1A-like n=1 Tax=Penaeus japonicus TaxID=27405 RepID=UPI001C714986|nr:cuticle protein AMP1A-like [Penaeus japonicus]
MQGSALRLSDIAPPLFSEQRYIKVVLTCDGTTGLLHIDIMKIIVLACLAAVAVATPQFDDRVVALLRDDRVANEDGTFSYALEADNGINTAVAGVVGSAGQINQEGSYTYTLADGTQAVVTFVANENGFQPQSSILPTPHPLPAHVYELLEIAERQRAAGIVFN